MRPPRPGSGGALSQIGSRWGGSGTGVAGTCLFPGALSQRPGETALDPHPSALTPFLRAAESWGCLGRRWVRDAPPGPARVLAILPGRRSLGAP